VLPSGLTVVTERMPEVRSVALGFWINVGSRDEPAPLQGSSHFLEHLLFKGTTSRSASDIAEAFDAVGGEANAMTEKEYSCLFGRVLDRDLPMAAELLSDMMLNSVIAEQDVEAERNVIIEELAMLEDTPEDLVHDLFAETLFGPHPLGREIMGTTATVRSIDRADLLSFHEVNYRSANICVAAAGNVEHEQVLKWIGDGFGAGEEAPVPRALHPPESRGPVRVLNRSAETAHIVIGGLGYRSRHKLRFAWGVLDNVLGGGMSSRLFQEIRERRGLVYSIFSYRNLYTETGAYATYAGTSPASARQVVDLITDELDGMLEAGVSEKELERAKGHMKGGVVLALEDPSSRMSRLGKSVIVGGELLPLDEILARIDSVTVEEVAAVAGELLDRTNRILTVIGPFDEGAFDYWADAG
jgi:predicted Zn-dependent peptidase